MWFLHGSMNTTTASLRSHINCCVYDSTWEASDAFVLDHADEVSAWAKNDHLGFEIIYIYRGVVRKYHDPINEAVQHLTRLCSTQPRICLVFCDVSQRSRIYYASR